MNKHTQLVLALSVGLSAALSAYAADSGHDHAAGGMMPPAASTATPPTDQAAAMEAAIAAYPMNTCVVSGDELDGGSMEKPVNYVYKVEGQPDRLVRFCCKDCVRDFKKDPAKYLAMIDAAAAGKVEAAKAADKPADHSGHNH